MNGIQYLTVMNIHVTIFFVHCFVLKLIYCCDEELHLYNDIFKDYSPLPRPVSNIKDAVNVSLGLTLNQLLDVKEKDELIKVSTWTRQRWYDTRLTWDPNDYSGIKELNVEPKSIWKPDIYLYNNVEEEKEAGGTLDTSLTKVILRYDGRQTWLAPVILKGKCDMDMTYFPFDTQVCSLKFGSWTYDMNRLNLYNESHVIDIGMYTSHSEWSLKSAVASRNQKKYECCEELFPDVTFTITISRRTLFYQLNLILPIIVMGLLALCTFLLPAESGERIGLCITLLLSMTVFMLVVMDTIPATSECVPLVTIFFKSCMVEQVIMIMVLCHIMRMYHKRPDDPPMSEWTRYFILDKLSYIVRVRVRDRTQLAVPVQFIMSLDDNENEQSDEKFEKKSVRKSNNGTLLCSVTNHREGLEEFHEHKGSEWRLVAMTLDRVLLMFFLLLYASIIFVFYLLAPSFID